MNRKVNIDIKTIAFLTVIVAIIFMASAQIASDDALITECFETNYYYSGSDMYICEAYPGNTDEDGTYWRICKVFNYASDASCVRWANGTNEFRHQASQRATYTYSNSY